MKIRRQKARGQRRKRTDFSISSGVGPIETRVFNGSVEMEVQPCQNASGNQDADKTLGLRTESRHCGFVSLDVACLRIRWEDFRIQEERR